MSSISTLTLLILLAFSALAEEAVKSPAAASGGKEISGVVRLIRGQPETEVFFKDLKDSVIIGKDSKHNEFYNACEESQKKGTPVKLVIHPISRKVLDFPKASPAPEAAQDPKSSAAGFAPIPSSDEENSK